MNRADPSAGFYSKTWSETRRVDAQQTVTSVGLRSANSIQKGKAKINNSGTQQSRKGKKQYETGNERLMTMTKTMTMKTKTRKETIS